MCCGKCLCVFSLGEEERYYADDDGVDLQVGSAHFDYLLPAEPISGREVGAADQCTVHNQIRFTHMHNTHDHVQTLVKRAKYGDDAGADDMDAAFAKNVAAKKKYKVIRQHVCMCRRAASGHVLQSVSKSSSERRPLAACSAHPVQDSRARLFAGKQPCMQQSRQRAVWQVVGGRHTF